MLPLLLKPRYYAFRNRWTRSVRTPNVLIRDITALALSLLLMGATYNGTYKTLHSLSEQTHLIYVPPSTPLAILFFALASILVFSGVVSALGSLFYSEDVEFLQSTPIPRHSLFSGKLLDSLLSSSWLIVIFSLPILLAFGTYYHAGWSFYCSGVILGTCLTITTASLAFACAIFCSSLLSAYRLRDLVLVLFLFALGGSYLYLRFHTGEIHSLSTSRDILQITSMSRFPTAEWLPSSWLANSLALSLNPHNASAAPFWGALLSLTLASISVAYLSFAFLYSRAFSRLQHSRRPAFAATHKRRLPWLTRRVIHPTFRALFGKEWKLFVRDVTQAVQLVLLLALCLVYLYNFQLFNEIDSVELTSRPWFERFLILSNILLGGFVVLAVCARFVFPSISLEGKSLWILLSSPLSLHDVLRLKFISWYCFISVMSLVIFCSGGLAIQLPPTEVVILGVFGLFLSASLCSLAVGFGAAFAEFDWENPSQITASLGNFLYIVSAGGVLLIQLVPIGLFLLLDTLATLEPLNRGPGVGFTFIITTILIAYINVVATRWGLQFGSRNLARLLPGS